MWNLFIKTYNKSLYEAIEIINFLILYECPLCNAL